MELRFSELLSLLPEYAPATSSALTICPRPSRVVSLYDNLNDGPPHENYLYFGRASEARLTGANYVLWEDVPLDRSALADGDANVLLTSARDEYTQIKRGVVSLFEDRSRLNDCSMHLLDLAQSGAKVHRILEYVSMVLGNPVFLLDPSLFLVDSAGPANMSDDRTIAYVLANGMMPQDYIDEMLKENSANSHDNVLVVWEQNILDHRVIAGRIVLDDKLLGYLKVFETGKPFNSRFDSELLQLASRYLALSVRPAVPTDNPQIESFMRGIIEHRLPSAEQIDRRREQLGLELLPRMAAIVVELDDAFRNRDKLYLLRKRLQTFFNRHTLLLYGDQIVILYDRHTTAELYDPERLRRLEQFLVENNCRAAMSAPFKHLGSLAKSYVHASACFGIARGLGATERVMLYENYKIYHLLLLSSDTLDLSDLVCPSVKQLLELDAAKGSDLAQTLFEYLRNHQDVTLTSRCMQIHYNSLRYRLNRITALTGIDFDDSDMVFKILLSEKALKIRALTEEPHPTPGSAPTTTETG